MLPEWLQNLSAFLMWVTTVGAGLFAYWLTNRVDWDRLAEANPGLSPGDLAIMKRVFAWLVAGGVAILAWLVQVAMLYTPPPGDWRETIEVLFGVVAVAAFAAQTMHTVRDLPQKNSEARALDVLHHSGYEIRLSTRK